jgi:hypothetical protein
VRAQHAAMPCFSCGRACEMNAVLMPVCVCMCVHVCLGGLGPVCRRYAQRLKQMKTTYSNLVSDFQRMQQLKYVRTEL